MARVLAPGGTLALTNTPHKSNPTLFTPQLCTLNPEPSTLTPARGTLQGSKLVMMARTHYRRQRRWRECWPPGERSHSPTAFRKGTALLSTTSSVLTLQPTSPLFFFVHFHPQSLKKTLNLRDCYPPHTPRSQTVTLHPDPDH